MTAGTNPQQGVPGTTRPAAAGNRRLVPFPRAPFLRILAWSIDFSTISVAFSMTLKHPSVAALYNPLPSSPRGTWTLPRAASSWLTMTTFSFLGEVK